MNPRCLLGHWWMQCACDKCEAGRDDLLSEGMPCGFRHSWSICMHCGKKKAPR